MSELKQIPLDKILPNPDQPRKVMDQSKINVLADSMREVGQKTTAKVRPLTPEESARYPGYEYLMLGGHRRLEAAIRVGLETLRCEVLEANPEEDDLTGFVDNESEEMHWLDKDLALERLYIKHKAKGGTQQTLAAQLGITQARVSYAITIAEALSIASKALIYNAVIKSSDNWEITERPILALAALKDPEKVEKALPVVLDRKFTEPEVKDLVAHIQAGGDPATFEPTQKVKKPRTSTPKKVPANQGSPIEPQLTPQPTPSPSVGAGEGVSGNGPGTVPTEDSSGGGKGGSGGGTPAEITPVLPIVAPVTPVEPVQETKTSKTGAFVAWVFGKMTAIGAAIAKRTPKQVKVGLKFLGRFIAIPHHPCNYLANKMVPIGHSSGSKSSHSHSGSGVSLLLLARHWGLYLLMLPFSYVGAIALTGFLVGHLLAFTRAWFDHLTGYLVHLLFGQVLLGWVGQALHEPVTALILGGIILWLLYETARPPRGVLFVVAAVLAVAWLFRGWWMGALHVSLPSGLPSVNAPASTTPAPLAASPAAQKPIASKPKTPNSKLLTPNSTSPSYVPSKPWSATDEDRNILDAELAAFPQPCRVMDCPVMVDSAMGDSMAAGRLQDLADADKYTLMQGHDKKQIQSVLVGATGLTLALPGGGLGPLPNPFGIGGGPVTIAFFWEDVRAIHCNKVETVSDHPETVYQLGLVVANMKKPFTVQCANAENMEHLVSAMEFYIQKAQGGHRMPIGSIPYPSQGVRLDGEGRPVVMWENSPVEKAGVIFGDRVWGVDADSDARQKSGELEAALQALTPGKHSLYAVTPKAWDDAKREEDIHSNESPIPQRRALVLNVP